MDVDPACRLRAVYAQPFQIADVYRSTVAPSAYANGSPVFPSRSPVSLLPILPACKGDQLQHCSYCWFFSIFMPRLPPLPSGLDHTSSPSDHGSGYFPSFRTSFVFLVAAVAIRMVIIGISRTTRRSPGAIPAVQVEEEEEEEEKEKDAKSTQTSCENNSTHCHIRDIKDCPPEIKPIYPWITPPQTLPGPYDPRLYPLPTIRRHSYDPSVSTPEQGRSISYSRRVSTNDIPSRQTTLHGSITTSTRGWRRNQWAISGT